MRLKTPLQCKKTLAALAIIGAVLSPASLFGAAQVVAYWDFEQVEADGVSIKAAVGPYTGTIRDGATLTEPGEGRPIGGGRAFNVSRLGDMRLEATGDDNPMNKAAVDDQISIALWQKNNSNVDSASFWAWTENATSAGRGFQFHIPWSDGTVYFDTMGCCNADTRLSRNVETAFPGFDWTAWHHYAFVKNGEHKAIYIDGNLLTEADGYLPMTTEFIRLTIGSDDGTARTDGIIDDFAIFKGALSEAEIKLMVAGARPGSELKDTDKDGMPDDWETQFGLDPNDATDAAKDANGNGFSNLEEFQKDLDPTNTTKPVLTSVASTDTYDQVILTFSKTLDPVSAVNKANYAITPSLAITDATLKKNVVTLTTAKQTPGATAYTVTVNNVKDVNNWPLTADTKATLYTYIGVREGVLKLSYWGNITGTPVDNLVLDPRYPASPDMVKAVFSLNTRDAFPTDALDNYGATMEGFITPTESGDYDFFLRSDDASQLYLSTDSTEANMWLIAEETGCCNAFLEVGAIQTSLAPVTLVAGRKYMIRVIYKEGGGGDFAQVAWRKTTDTTPAASLLPIPGRFLSSATDVPAPAEGSFITQTPAPNAKNISPAAGITLVHRDGKTAWTADNVTLKYDGVAVTPTFTKVGNTATITYKPSALLASKSTHTVTVGYLDPGNNPATLEWSFEAAPYSGNTKDKVASNSGLIMGNAVFTADAGGRTAKAGDYAVDFKATGGYIFVPDVKFLNDGLKNDAVTVTLWQKRYDVSDSYAFWATSQASATRGLSAHAPWSDASIYFDTAGCCDATTQRISANIDTFSGYTGDATWWNNWHHFAFVKQGENKRIYIDGTLFLEGSSTGVLPTDFYELYIGAATGAANPTRGLFDDVAFFSTQLTEADVKSLAGTTLPSALPASKGLIAYWDFNDAQSVPATPPTLKAEKTANGLVLTFEGALQSADSVSGPWTDLTGASPQTVPTTGAGKYFRAKR